MIKSMLRSSSLLLIVTGLALLDIGCNLWKIVKIFIGTQEMSFKFFCHENKKLTTSAMALYKWLVKKLEITYIHEFVPQIYFELTYSNCS